MDADRKELEELIIRVKTVFSSPEGETLLGQMGKEFHADDGTFNEDPNKMYFMEGQRAVVWWIRNLKSIDLDLLRQQWKQEEQEKLTDSRYF